MLLGIHKLKPSDGQDSPGLIQLMYKTEGVTMSAAVTSITQLNFCVSTCRESCNYAQHELSNVFTLVWSW